MLVEQIMDAIALARRIKAADSFGPLHIVVADGNVEDEHIVYCVNAQEPRACTDEERKLCDDLLARDEALRHFAFWLTYYPEEIDALETKLSR